MATEIIASKEKSQTARGQNQDLTSVSARAKQLPIIPKVAPPNAVTANANAKDDDARLAQISRKPIKAHDGLPVRTASSGSPGGAVPTKTNHTAKR